MDNLMTPTWIMKYYIKNIAFYVWVRDILRLFNKKYYTFIITVKLICNYTLPILAYSIHIQVLNISLYKLNDYYEQYKTIIHYLLVVTFSQL
ncbi:unnamed protein product [Rhizophagus irregularis]|nr:unnamed protein product [Rhizophagus irregularis]